jgi:hypothetical protein
VGASVFRKCDKRCLLRVYSVEKLFKTWATRFWWGHKPSPERVAFNSGHSMRSNFTAVPAPLRQTSFSTVSAGTERHDRPAQSDPEPTLDLLETRRSTAGKRSLATLDCEKRQLRPSAHIACVSTDIAIPGNCGCATEPMPQSANNRRLGRTNAPIPAHRHLLDGLRPRGENENGAGEACWSQTAQAGNNFAGLAMVPAIALPGCIERFEASTSFDPGTSVKEGKTCP